MEKDENALDWGHSAWNRQGARPAKPPSCRPQAPRTAQGALSGRHSKRQAMAPLQVHHREGADSCVAATW